MAQGVPCVVGVLSVVVSLGCDRGVLFAPRVPIGMGYDSGLAHTEADVTDVVLSRDAREAEVGERTRLSETLSVVPDVPEVRRPRRAAFDLPMAEAWPAVNRWSAAMESEYSAFVTALGAAVAERRCGRLDRCLRDRTVNTLYDEGDQGLSFSVDCADLPYLLRGYFAFKRRLPFGYVSRVVGVGDDDRYTVNTRPVEWTTWTRHRSPRRLFSEMTSAVHSGMYRLSPRRERGDFYPCAVRRGVVRPGTAFYDPNGHVLVVTEVRRDGVVYLLDGHPDGSLTYKRFGEAFAIGSRGLGGGFKNFRPLRWDGRVLHRAANTEIDGFDGESQWSPAVWSAGAHTETGETITEASVQEQRLRGHHSRHRRRRRTTAIEQGYYDWVRRSLAASDAVIDPVQEFREQVVALCRDVADRADAVQTALRAGLQNRPHPGALPWNIYGTSGEWETYSTPSRDARLKASFRQLYAHTQHYATEPARRDAMRGVWAALTAESSCQVSYTATSGRSVSLTLGDVIERLFSLSFDPYHCPELRWGAPEGSEELRGCNDSAEKLGWYRLEQRLRNRVDREYGVATRVNDGPERPPVVDVRVLLGVAR